MGHIDKQKMTPEIIGTNIENKESKLKLKSELTAAEQNSQKNIVYSKHVTEKAD